jgi:hypothetical protein
MALPGGCADGCAGTSASVVMVMVVRLRGGRSANSIDVSADAELIEP